MIKVTEFYLQKQDHVLAVAYEVFQRMGYKQAKIRDIALEAGISRTTLYRYFRNKQEMVDLLLSRQEDYALRSLEYLHDDSIIIAEKLNRMLELKFKVVSEWGSLLIKDLMGDDYFQERIHEIQANMAEEFIEWLRLEQEGGNINKAYEPEFIFALMTKLEYLIMDEDLQEFYPDMADLIVILLNITLDGVRTRK